MELSAWFHRSFEPHHEGPGLILLGAGVGLLTGLGAVLFHYLIAGIHNAAILGTFGIAQNAREHTPVSPWGAWIILVPVIGALLVTVLVRNFAPEAQGAGVSQILRAVHADRGHMRPVIAIIRPVATAITIGTGGSAGREGPAMQFGAAIGALVGHLFRVPDHRRIHLLGCGVGAGIAAVFNAPLGGWFLAMEVIVPDWRPWTVLSTLVATVSASWVTQEVFGSGHLLAHAYISHWNGSLMLPTLNYHVLLPAMVTALTAFAVRRVFLQDSIYTLPLHREGLPVPENHYIVEEKMDDK
ncbi:Cl- channel voltage-gated family protein [Acidithiobacillus ferrivorans SS3]|uniref:Cl-channel voltage-gated family protein n=1 Tax=Acidithiobacillus ferrivorans SS3 TaxID=743299 RepID=G0JLQ6_9PROT|nr:chloride channel protein [Acidithiobacillus ferrivorans]AEM49218.1 Cl- channel voltage-gated family protein [Acidithiobacillus ferrivorans SS3]